MRSILCWSRSHKGNGTVRGAGRRELVLNTGAIKFLICGSITLALGCISFIWTPYDLMKDEILRMRKGLPPYNWWVIPSAEVLMKIHIFNITNYDEVMNGIDENCKVQEVGPFIYRENVLHANVTKHPNGTMTYIAHRRLEYLPELNTLSLNDTVIVPNIPYLGFSSYLADWHFVARMGFNLMARRYNPQPFVKISIYDLLWNNTDPMLDFAYKMVPNMVPKRNFGYLSMIYDSFSVESTVFIGPQHPGKFFTLERYNKNNRLGYWPDETCDSLEMATEGVVYHQNIKKDEALRFLRKTVCRILPIKYKEEVEMFGLDAYNFSLPADVFHRPSNISEDCYTLPDTVPLPNGLSDVSKCFYNFPLVASLPHFLSVNSSDLRKMEGYTPDERRHISYIVVEPITGVPLQSIARMQCNLKMKDVSSFSVAAPYKNMYFPLFWIELNQDHIPKVIKVSLYLLLVITPKIQALISTGLVALGMALLYFRVIRGQKTIQYKGNYISLDPIPQVK